MGQKIVDYACQDQEISRIDVGDGRKILITAGNCWEISRPIFYQITENGRIIVPTTYIGGDSGDDDHQYKSIFAEGGTLVGLVETTKGMQDLVVIQDFRAGESWPRVGDCEVSYEENVVKRHQSLFERLLKENPSLPRPEGLRPPIVTTESRSDPCSCQP